MTGKEYQLAINDNENNLHSGPDGYEKRKWEVVSQGENTISFALESPDGDQGYPGNCLGACDLHADRMTMRSSCITRRTCDAGYDC